MIIKRYIARCIIEQTIMVLVIVCAVFLIFTFLDEIGDLGLGQYNLYALSAYVLMQLPFQLQNATVLIITIGMMLGLGKLISHYEIVAARSQGLSIKKIIKTAIITGVLMIIVIIILNELFTFRLNYFAQNYRFSALGENKMQTQQIWLKPNTQQFLNIDSKYGNQLQLFTIKNNRLVEIISAEKIHYLDGQIQIDAVHKKDIYYDSQTKQQRLQSKKIRQQYLDIELPEHIAENLKQDPKLLSSAQLYQQINYLSQSSLNTHQYVVVLYQRLAQPFLLIAMMIIAISFTLSFSKFNLAKPILIGIILSLIIHIINRLTVQLSLTFAYPPLLSIYLPIVLLLIVAVLLLIFRLKKVL